MIRGLFIGRFQPFHLGHLHIVKTALKEVDKLIICIGSSNKKDKDNPFSAEERKKIISLVLKKNKIKNCSVFLLPDFSKDEGWIDYIEKKLPRFDVVFISDKNTEGEKWIEKCLGKKFKIKKIRGFKKVNAAEIRKKMQKNERWEHLVPEEVAGYIKILKYKKR